MADWHGQEGVSVPFSSTMLDPVRGSHDSVSDAWVYSCLEHPSVVVLTFHVVPGTQQLLNHVFIFHRSSFKAWHPFHNISCMSYVCHCSKTNSVFIFLFSLFPPILFLSHTLCSLSGFWHYIILRSTIRIRPLKPLLWNSLAFPSRHATVKGFSVSQRWLKRTVNTPKCCTSRV